jgi:hypothetical protein
MQVHDPQNALAMLIYTEHSKENVGILIMAAASTHGALASEFENTALILLSIQASSQYLRRGRSVLRIHPFAGYRDLHLARLAASRVRSCRNDALVPRIPHLLCLPQLGPHHSDV